MSGEALSTLVLLGSFFVMIMLRFPIAYIVRNIRVYFPSLYYHITSFRGVYKG